MSLPVRRAYIVEELQVSKKFIDWPLEKKQWEHLKDLPLQPFNSDTVGVLIGANAARALVQLETRQPIGKDGPIAVRTMFGWSVLGEIPSSLNRNSTKKSDPKTCRAITSHPVEPNVQQEKPCRENRQASKKADEDVAMNILKSTIRKVDGHYEVGLLWRSREVNLPNNRGDALKYFFSNEARCRADPAYHEVFSKGIERYEQMGFSRKLEVHELQGPVGRTWYLPYFVTHHARKKPRLVFNASKRSKGRSLNEELLPGPDLACPIAKVITLLRENPFAVSMDLKDFFLNVRVREEDQPALRYFYRKLGSSGPPNEYQMMVEIFGSTCSMTSCIFALRQLAEDHPEFADVIERIIENFYVDNYLDSFESEEEAIYFCRKLIQLLQLGGFNLTQLMSTSRRIMKSFPDKAKLSPELDMDLMELPVDSALGLSWNCQKDVFVFKLSPNIKASTKREILSAVMSVYDPLFFLACVQTTCKILLQDIWRREREQLNSNRRKNWDRSIDDDLLDRWNKILHGWKNLELLEIPRCLLPNRNSDTSVEVHIFCDASSRALGAVAYVLSSSPTTAPQLRCERYEKKKRERERSSKTNLKKNLLQVRHGQIGNSEERKNHDATS